MATSNQSKKQKLPKTTTNSKKTASEQLNKTFVHSFERFQQLLSTISNSSNEALMNAISPESSTVKVPSKRSKIPTEDLISKISSSSEVSTTQIVQRPKGPALKVEQFDVALENIPLGANVLDYLRALFTP